MDQESYAGGCQCGAVRYLAIGPARNRCVCHCESCRRSVGANGVAWATFRQGDVRFTQAAVREFASSAHVLRGFCDRCGTSISYWNDARPEDIDLTVASMDEPERLVPQDHIWMADRISWDRPNDGLPQHPGWRQADSVRSRALDPRRHPGAFAYCSPEQPLQRVAWIELGPVTTLDEVGVTAAVSRALAGAGIACNMVAGAYHDHVFVPEERADEALEVLQRLEI